MNEQKRGNAKQRNDGHVIFQIDEGMATITVYSSVLEYLSQRKKEIEKVLENEELLDKAISVAKEFDTKPFTFPTHVLINRIYKDEEEEKINVNCKFIEHQLRVKKEYQNSSY